MHTRTQLFTSCQHRWQKSRVPKCLSTPPFSGLVKTNLSWTSISFRIISSFKTGPQAKHFRLPSLGEKLTKLIIQVVFVSLLYFPFRFEVSQSFSSKCYYLGQKESLERMYLLNVYCYGYGYHLKYARIVHIPPGTHPSYPTPLDQKVLWFGQFDSRDPFASPLADLFQDIVGMSRWHIFTCAQG